MEVLCIYCSSYFYTRGMQYLPHLKTWHNDGYFILVSFPAECSFFRNVLLPCEFISLPILDAGQKSSEIYTLQLYIKHLNLYAIQAGCRVCMCIGLQSMEVYLNFVCVTHQIRTSSTILSFVLNTEKNTHHWNLRSAKLLSRIESMECSFPVSLHSSISL